MKLLVVLLVLPVIAGACAVQRPADEAGIPANVEPDSAAVDTRAADPANVVGGFGRIFYIDLEGGFYGLVAQDGTRYNPLNLDDAFRQDSLVVHFRGVLRPDVMTTRMWGRNLEILDMMVVDVELN